MSERSEEVPSYPNIDQGPGQPDSDGSSAAAVASLPANAESPVLTAASPSLSDMTRLVFQRVLRRPLVPSAACPPRRPKRPAQEDGEERVSFKKVKSDSGDEEKEDKKIPAQPSTIQNGNPDHDVERERTIAMLKHEKVIATLTFSRWVKRLPFLSGEAHSDGITPHYLDHLKKYPFLKHMRFRTRHDKNVGVLGAFLMAHADLKTVKEVFEITRDSIMPGVIFSAFLIACTSESQEGVVEWLLDRDPDYILSTNDEGRNVLECVLNSNRSNEEKAQIVPLLLEKGPRLIFAEECIGELRHKEGMFHRALRNEFGDAISSLLFNTLADCMRLEKAIRYFSLSGGNIHLNVAQVTALSWIMPHLRKLDCLHCGWTYEGCRLFLDNLRQTRNLAVLSVFLPCIFFSSDNGVLAAALQQAIASSRLTKLTVIAATRGEGQEECFHAAINGANSNHGLQLLRLEGFSVERSNSLAALISSPGNKLKSLQLESISMEGPWPGDICGGPSDIEAIDIRNCTLCSDAFVGLLSRMCEMPKLKHLRLGGKRNGSPELDERATQCLATLLWQGKLQYLSLSCVKIDWKILSNLLKKDSVLEKLSISSNSESDGKIISESIVEALEDGNTSLQHAIVVAPQSITFRMEYLTALNRAGRGDALKENESQNDFVNRLAALEDGRGPCSKVNMIYGLLSLEPSLWSGSTVNSDEGGTVHRRISDWWRTHARNYSVRR